MGAVPTKCRMCATKKRISLLCCTLLFFYGQAFSQYEVLSPPWTRVLIKDVCWAKSNVDGQELLPPLQNRMACFTSGTVRRGSL